VRKIHLLALFLVHIENNSYFCSRKQDFNIDLLELFRYETIMAVMKTRMAFRGYRCLALLCMATLCVFLPGCRKEHGAMRFTLFTETMGGSSKVVVDGLTSSWRSGDQVWVNGVTGTVALDDAGDPKLTVNVNNWNGNYYAAYPASMVTGSGQNSVLSVTLPQAYQYREDATTHQQLLEMPMVACTGNDRITFKHLTGALVVQVPSTDTSTITLDYVMVQSSTSALSGTGTVNAGADSPQVTFGTDTTHTVVMYFDTCPVVMESRSPSKSIMIPIAPTTGEGHRFTVTVRAHTSEGTRVYYYYNGKSSVGNMLRNEVAVAPIHELREGHFLGDGTENSPFLIQTTEDYKYFLERVTNNYSSICTAYVKMSCDINFRGETIKSATGFFRGDFDGNGNTLKNIVVKPRYSEYCSSTVLSVFPPVSAGRIRNLSVENVSLDCSGVSTTNDINVGGLVSYIKTTGSNITFENISVSNVASVSSFWWNSSKRVCVGTIIGRLGQNGEGTVFLNNCSFAQSSERQCSLDFRSCYSFSFGGIAGVADGVDIDVTGCTIDYCGSDNQPGVNLLAYDHVAYVGALFGAITDCTFYLSSPSFTVRGYLSFSGTIDSYPYVARLVGLNRSHLGISGVNDSGLYFKKNGMLL